MVTASPGYLETLRARLPVSSVASRYVWLVKAGREMTGCSPFEKGRKDRSFFANDKLRTWRDVATNESGDIIDLVMIAENKSREEAIAILAALAGDTASASVPPRRAPPRAGVG
jgi:DNA primase